MLPYQGRALLLGYLLLGLAATIVVVPFLWILLTSFKHEIAIYSGTLWFLAFTRSTSANNCGTLF